MIYSGVDLIRRAEASQSLADKIVNAPRSVGTAEDLNPSADDHDTQGALLRFAKFVTDKKGGREKEKAALVRASKRRGGGNFEAYKSLDMRETQIADIGQILDIYA